MTVCKHCGAQIEERWLGKWYSNEIVFPQYCESRGLSSQKHEPLNMLDLPDQIAFEETQKMLKVLAEHFTQKTKLVIVPKGSMSWLIKVFPRPEELYKQLSDTIEYRTVEIPLIHFFNMMVGYNEELDILVYWIP